MSPIQIRSSAVNSSCYKVFLQARMTSVRLPGKVLAPFRGEPIIRHVLRRVCEACPDERVVVLTSTDATDDPLVTYLESLGVNLFRGPLDDVLERFRRCLQMHPCEWILRVSADSPMLQPSLLEQVLVHVADESCDLVTTTFPRTYPKGQNAELIRSKTLMRISDLELTEHDREHVTAYFYRNPQQFRIKNLDSGDPNLAKESVAIDTLEDLRRLEPFSVVETER